MENAETVIQTNYVGTKNMTKAMIPLMRTSHYGARIVSVTSRLRRLHGKKNRITNVSLRQQLEDVDSLTEEVIDNVIKIFLEQVKDGTWESGGWPQVFTDYSVSKVAVNAYTRLMARILEDRPEGHKIYINC
uniref:Putative ovule protein n=1 Tax=Solanum chacoense TaxID=4108 RepID=A0A0V0HQD6_SOLCH